METATPTESTTTVTTETPATEAVATPEVATEVTKPVVDDGLTSKYAAIAKREKAAREREQLYKRQIEELKKDAEEAKKYRELKSKARLDPDAWLKEAELDYDAITQYKLNGGKVTPETELSLLKKEIDSLKNRDVEREKAEQQAKEARAVAEYKTQLSQHVDKNAEKYELIKAYGEVESVYETIDLHYQQTGNIMDPDEACELVESYLEQKFEEDTKKLSTTKKFATKLASKPLEPKPAPKPSPEAKTLSNATETPPRLDLSMSPSERLKEAAKLINFAG